MLNSRRFPMTMGGAVLAITGLTVLIMVALMPIQFFVVWRHIPETVIRWVVLATLAAVHLTLLATLLLGPRAIRVERGRLVVERLGWSNWEIPLRNLRCPRLGPEIRMLGDVRRVAGNGGLMGFTGLFHVKGVGLVRAWATTWGKPTVLVDRVGERPLLLGVDDARGLMLALRQAGVSSR